MSNITIIIIGTTHETDKETKLFDFLNKTMKSKKFKNSIWLCEGDSTGRFCVSLKNIELHLLTDALFVNMMLIDLQKKNMGDNKDFFQILSDRLIELFITINKSKFKNQLLLSHNDFDCMQLLGKFNIYDNLNKFDKCILSGFASNTIIPHVKKLINHIIEISKKNGVINDTNKKCVHDFYQTGFVCEDEIMSNMRDHSFIKIIMTHIFNMTIDNKNIKKRFIITVGSDHVKPICDFLKKKNLKVKQIIV